ncbi:tyrosine/serine/threonine protein phosphatase [Thecaphora frezii]|uniref:protein-tyrosine-phosphatase n=1 Tax=Thecaphora frezii TaxID=1269715 RepID=A0A8T9MX82_9BASI|nr:putative rok1 protein [Thecaphora frezii]
MQPDQSLEAMEQDDNDCLELAQFAALSPSGVAASKSLRGIADFSHRMGKALPSLPEQHVFDERMDSEMAPPPTPGPSSFAPRYFYGANASAASGSSSSSSGDASNTSNANNSGARALSLVIPDNGQAYGGLSQPQPLMSLRQSNEGRWGSLHQATALPSLNSLSNPPKAKAGRKRPSKLTLVPPSALEDGGISSRSVPSSPAVSGRPPPQLRDRMGPDALSPSATKDLSSALRGTPRRRPSMPFQNKVKPAECDFKDPGSSRNRPPEAFRDPSEHILSGKGSTLQHARSVYSQGPVEILPGLFLGDEHNARDNEMLSDLGITTVLNVAKETVLPFQLETSNSPLHVRTPSKWLESSPARQCPPAVRLRKQSDDFFTPPTTAFPSASELADAEASLHLPPRQQASPESQQYNDAYAPLSASLLRNTASTPNLLNRFRTAPTATQPTKSEVARINSPHDRAFAAGSLAESKFLRYSGQRCDSSGSSDEAYDAASSPSSHAGTCTSSATELTPPAPNSSTVTADASKTRALGADPSPSVFVATAEYDREARSDVTNVALPWNATALKVPASPISARMNDLRYIKLPWTHDETDLAVPGGGFTHGCAIIAEALGIDSRVWDPSTVANDTSVLPLLFQGDRVDKLQSGSKGKVLVHCQCGVSRSATLVIAFVMQAAALRYGFEESRALMGMHDCYNMVKEKSASISPNISLIYQLVEWERQLSKAASKLRKALTGAISDEASEILDGEAVSQLCGADYVNPGWSVEVMDEEKWSQMRMQEEQKEAEDEQRRRDERLAEAKRAVAERKAASDRLEGKTSTDTAKAGSEPLVGGSLMQRRRKAAPALQLSSTRTGSEADARLSKPRPPMLTLLAQSSSNSGCLEDQRPPETPFLTAKTNAWRPHERTRSDSESSNDPNADVNDDVVMSTIESLPPPPPSVSLADSPCPSPLRTAAADEVVATEGQSAPAPRIGGGSLARGLSDSSLAMSPSPLSARSGSASGPRSTSRSSLDALQRMSVPMATSLSASGGRSRFSFSGMAAVFTPNGKRRPGSMAAGIGGAFSGSSGLFGAASQSKEERRKQHRRTFSSDLPALRAGLDLDKLVLPSGGLAEGIAGQPRSASMGESLLATRQS